jgi:hypothetical protein
VTGAELPDDGSVTGNADDERNWQLRTLLVLALTAAASLAFVLEIGTPIQPLVVGVFLVLAPGAAVLSRMRRWPLVVWTMAAIATSLSIVSLLTAVLFYAHAWSPGAVITSLALGCAACVVAGALSGHGHTHRGPAAGTGRPDGPQQGPRTARRSGQLSAAQVDGLPHRDTRNRT